jgi:hypothetical protein
MKKLLLFTFLFTAQFITAQIDNVPVQDGPITDTLIYNTVSLENQPEFPGGKESFHNFFNVNFKIPKGEVIKDKIVTMFIVEKDGSLSNIKVLRGGGLETKKEVIRVLSNSPRWKPGIQNGKMVRTLYSTHFPINNVSIPARRKK